MTVKMELDQEEKAKDYILERLNESGEPLSAFEIYPTAIGINPDKPTIQSIRRAIWYLLDEGKIKFTGGNKIFFAPTYKTRRELKDIEELYLIGDIIFIYSLANSNFKDWEPVTERPWIEREMEEISSNDITIKKEFFKYIFKITSHLEKRK